MGRIRKKKQEKHSLKWNMIGMLVLVWLLPLALASSVMFFFVSGKLKTHMEESITISGEKAVELCQMRFDDAVGASRNASYMNTIRDGYYRYLENGDKRQIQNTVSGFLNDQYRFNSAFQTTMLYFVEKPDIIFYTYSNMKGNAYDKVRYFEREAMETVRARAGDLGTDILFLDVEGRLYMVRNMMTGSFRPFAVIVMEIDKTAMFKSLESIMGYQGYEIYLDGVPIADNRDVSGEETLYQRHGQEGECRESVHNFGREDSYLYDRVRFEGHDLEFFVVLDTQTMLNEQNFIPYLVIIFLISMIPLILLVLWFFHREVTAPVDLLVSAAHKIEEGDLGYNLPGIGNSRELSYLGESFNQMSSELKHQFDTIYSEELALRDAKIMAMQSQINPHFLNNTLEIINWEARMNGNFKVSGMIEALSTMLEATLNRSKVEYIPLAEEINYMDAYLYIVTRRFEDKLEVHKNIDESLLAVQVPRLIIQPIVENAVEHGIDDQNRIIINIDIADDEQETSLIRIRIKNHGTLSPKDEEKIRNLLGGNVEQGERSLNLGIRNVNQRLKIIYGPPCGLTIQNTPDGSTLSTLTLRKEIPKENEGHLRVRK